MKNTGLGDYIHYRAQRYVFLGINRNFGRSISLYDSIQNAYREAMDQIKKYAIGTKTAKEIEDTLNDYLSINGNDFLVSTKLGQTQNDQEIKEFMKLIEQLIKTNAYSYDPSNLSGNIIECSKDIIKGSAKVVSSLNKRENERVYWSTLDKIIKSLEKEKKEVINSIIRNKNRKSEKAIQLKKSLDNKKTELEKVINGINSFKENKNNLYQNNTKIYNKTEELKDLLQTALKLTAHPNNSRLYQALSETFVPWALLKQYSYANKSIEELLKEVKKIVQENKSIQVIDNISPEYANISELLNNIDNNQSNFKWEQKGSTIEFSTLTNNTVDMDINLSDNDTENIRASIKNYSNPSYSNIDILHENSMSLLIILNLLNTNFSNHYLNLIAQQNGNIVDKTSKQNLTSAENTIKLGMALRGLSGARTKNFEFLSQYFIVNDQSGSSGQHFRVIPTETLIERIAPNPGQFNNNIANVTGLPTLNSIKNDWVEGKGGEKTRISKVLAQAHMFKLGMTLNYKAAFNLP